MFRGKKLLGIPCILGLLAVQSYSITINPTYTTFGTLPGATFGGSGIPNNAVAITTFDTHTKPNKDGHDVTLALTAHQRYDNPPVLNDGAGTFTALSGDDSAHGQPTYARWNVGVYLKYMPEIYSDSSVLAMSQARLYFDTDPAAGNDTSTYLPAAVMQYEDSLNLGMSFFNPPIDPDVPGEYGVFLGLYTPTGELLKQGVGIVINVVDPNSTSVADKGGTSLLLAMSAFGCVALRRKK